MANEPIDERDTEQREQSDITADITEENADAAEAEEAEETAPGAAPEAAPETVPGTTPEAEEAEKTAPGAAPEATPEAEEAEKTAPEAVPEATPETERTPEPDFQRQDANPVPPERVPPLSVPQSEAKRPHSNGVKALLISLAALLCVALCFGAGVLGNKIGGNQTPELTPTPIPTATASPTENPSFDVTATPTGSITQKATELPDMNKSDPLDAVDYYGSAGKDGYETLAEAIHYSAPSVVEIRTETVTSSGWFGNYVTSGAGSGVIISADGYIVTNNHVIEGASTILVRLSDGTEYSATLIGRDESTDIAVIFVETTEALTPASLGCSQDLIVGEEVFAIGNPLGSLGGTVTNGIISATAREITVDGNVMTLLQTNAAVNPGNSGGGLFNRAGQLIGIVNAKYSQDDVEGLGFAIPIDSAYSVICELIQYHYVRGVVDTGWELYDISSGNAMTAWRYFNSTAAGVYILESANSDEFLYGDRIVSIDGTAVSTADEVEALISRYAVGDTVTVYVARMTVERQGARSTMQETVLELSLTLTEYVPDGTVRFAD